MTVPHPRARRPTVRLLIDTIDHWLPFLGGRAGFGSSGVSTQSHSELDVAGHKLLAWLGNTGTTVAILAGITASAGTVIAAGNIPMAGI
jgi:hypothetical protein